MFTRMMIMFTIAIMVCTSCAPDYDRGTAHNLDPISLEEGGGTRQGSNIQEEEDSASVENTVTTPNVVKEAGNPETFGAAYGTMIESVARAHGLPTRAFFVAIGITSEWGTSRLAIENLNFGGVECFSNSCNEGHCTEYGHKTYYRKYHDARDGVYARAKMWSNGGYHRKGILPEADDIAWLQKMQQNAASKASEDYYTVEFFDKALQTFKKLYK